MSRRCSRHTSPVTRHSGFTLLELLVVMGIIILILAFAAPAVTTLSKSNNLNTAGRLVSNVLTTARSEAINQRRLTQVRFVTKWSASGTEDTTASYHKFSVWRLPQPDDTLQSNDPNDPYVQISKWETLPSGVSLESSNDPTSAYSLSTTTTNPKYAGTYFLNSSLTNRKTNIQVPNGKADIAFIEFAPTGSVNLAGTVPGRVYLLLTEGIWDGTSTTYTHANHPNWFVTTVDTLAGRINVLRP